MFNLKGFQVVILSHRDFPANLSEFGILLAIPGDNRRHFINAKAKPVERQGRKAADLHLNPNKMAELPKGKPPLVSSAFFVSKTQELNPRLISQYEIFDFTQSSER